MKKVIEARSVQRVVFIAIAVVLLLHLVIVAKSYIHLRAGVDFENTGQVRAAAREYQASMGYHAPLNPFCRSSAHRLAELVERVGADDPKLGRDLGDRLQRSLLATRSVYQPHGELLNAGERPEDPNMLLFAGALAGLLSGFGVWWWPGLVLWRRIGASLAGLLTWAALLHLC